MNILICYVGSKAASVLGLSLFITYPTLSFAVPWISLSILATFVVHFPIICLLPIPWLFPPSPHPPSKINRFGPIPPSQMLSSQTAAGYGLRSSNCLSVMLARVRE
jgi:hypothetical protein